MIFVIDIDDTISDTDAYSEQYILNFFKKHNMPYKLVQKVARFAEKKFDWSTETAISWYKQYGDQMMLEFPCKAGAVETINSWFDAGHTIVLATARATDWHTDPETTTKKWLSNIGLKYHKIYLNLKTKEQICKEENADIFVDDDLTHCEKVLSLNTKTKPYLTTTAFNKNFEIPTGITRVDSLLALSKLLEEDKKI